jgi:proliferating cell nuclear antigen
MVTMFEAKFSSATLLKCILDSVKDLVTEANLLITEDGVELQAMDIAHVALVTFTILPEACTLYSCDEEVTLGVNLTNFAKILKCAEPTDSVVLRHQNGGATLGISFESSTGSKISDFAMNLMDIESEYMSIPDVEYSCSIKMPSSEFAKIVQNMAAFGETATLSVNETLALETTGDTGKVQMVVKQDLNAKTESARTEIVCSKPVKANFALKYLMAFTKGSGLSDQVQIAMLQDVPIYVTYDMDYKGSVGYYLAPKLDD